MSTSLNLFIPDILAANLNMTMSQKKKKDNPRILKLQNGILQQLNRYNFTVFTQPTIYNVCI